MAAEAVADILDREAELELHRKLAAKILRAYELGEGVEFDLLEQKTNVTFRVDCRSPQGKAARYVLRICRPGGYTRSEILSEAQWLAHLRRHWGMAVPEPVAARDGSLVTLSKVEGLGRPRASVLFKWVPGCMLESSLDPHRARQMGQLLGRLHRSAEAFRAPSGFSRPTWDCDRLFGRGEVIPSGLDEPLVSGRSRRILDRAAELVRRQVEPLGRDPEVFGLIHKDLEPDNALLHEGVLHAIDFADCGWGYFLYDIAASLLPLREKKGFAEMQRAFLSGYRSVRPLSDRHEALIETFSIARGLFAVRLMVLETMKIPRVKEYAQVAIPHILGEIRRFVTQHDGAAALTGEADGLERMTTIQFLSSLRGLQIKLWAEGEKLRFKAPQGVMTARLIDELKERKAEVLGFLGQGRTVQRSSGPLKAEGEGPAPLSFAQQRLWFIEQLLPGSVEYNIARAVRLSGPLRMAVLERCLNEVIRRHAALRTRFELREGRPVQVAAPHVFRPLPLVDLQGLPAASRQPEVMRLARRAAHRPFDLARGPLIRITLLRLGPQEHVAVSTMHHIVGDGWSTGLLFREIGALYLAFDEGRPSPLPELAIQYADFARWQRRYMTGEVLQQQLGYWRRQMQGAPPLLELPTDRTAPPVRSSWGGRHPLLLPRRLADPLKALGQAEGGATLFMVLLAAFNALLYRYTGQTDIVAGFLIANRNRTEIEPLIGFFVNTLLLRCRLGGDMSYRRLLGQVRRTTLEAYAHQDLPFERLVQELRPQRRLYETPLFQVTFVLQNVPQPDTQVSSFRMSLLPPINQAVEFNLSCDMKEMPEGVRTSWKFRRDIFDAATVARMAGHYLNLVREILQDPDRQIGRLALLNPAQRHQLLCEWRACAPDGGLGAGARLCVLDAQSRLLPPGCCGEVWAVKGSEQTPTGLRGRFDPRGTLQVLGRVDQLVELGGRSIDLAQLERTLASHPQVARCAVLLQEGGLGEKALRAYVEPDRGAAPSRRSLRMFLRDRLWPHQVPSAYVFLGRLPAGPDGEVDRQALSRLAVGPPEDSRPSKAAGPVEAALLRLWEEFLKVESVGLQDDFFALGGHSMMALLLLERIGREFGCRIAPAQFFRHSILEDLAWLVGREAPVSAKAGVPGPEGEHGARSREHGRGQERGSGI